MSLAIHPDPAHPAGGYAFLELPAGSLPKTPVSVAVFDAYGERWLAPGPQSRARVDIGDATWQPERADFGPYEVHRHDGADWVRIGPEIVNRLDEYMPVRIEVDALAFDVSWPDDVPPRAGAAVLGGLRPVERKLAGGEPDRLVAQPAPDPVEPPARPEGPEPQPPAPDEDGASGGETRRGSLVWPLAILLAVAAAVLGYLWFTSEEDGGATGPAETDRCSLSALSALAGGFAAQAEAMRACGADLSPEIALGVIENAAAQENGDALLLFGTLYDGTRLDPRIETLVGLTFDDDPAKAAEYYARAARAGAAEAQSHLAAVCGILSGLDATLEKGAYDDFCS